MNGKIITHVNQHNNLAFEFVGGIWEYEGHDEPRRAQRVSNILSGNLDIRSCLRQGNLRCGLRVSSCPLCSSLLV